MALVKFLMNGDALLMVQGVRRNILHDDRTSTDHRIVTPFKTTTSAPSQTLSPIRTGAVLIG